jgi:hypothetical protein
MRRLAAILMGASFALGSMGIASAQTYKSETKTKDETGTHKVKTKTKVKHHGKEVKTKTKESGH